MHAWSRLICVFAGDKRGATAVEYGLLSALIVLVVLAGMQAMGGGTGALYATFMLIAGTL
jgi:Flp pilus assembly pilin Flp